MLIAGLIHHPDMGLILFECGSAQDVQKVGTLLLSGTYMMPC